jgi:hypothetical protein
MSNDERARSVGRALSSTQPARYQPSTKSCELASLTCLCYDSPAQFCVEHYLLACASDPCEEKTQRAWKTRRKRAASARRGGMA